MGKSNSGLGAKNYLSAGACRQFAMPADKIGVQVSLDHILDPKVLRRGFLDILIDVALRIDDCRLTFRTNQVRSMRQTGKIELFKVHKFREPSCKLAVSQVRKVGLPPLLDMIISSVMFYGIKRAGKPAFLTESFSTPSFAAKGRYLTAINSFSGNL